jgi:DsbC/DsbD-like thiol-disulfide interchange protein
VRTPHVELRFEAEHASVKAGQTLWVALRFDLVPHWHVYWRNPGDSGEAPRVQWQLPDGWQAGEVHWPVPSRIRIGPLVNLGYEDSMTLLVPIRVASLPGSGDSARITAQATWLVCREECIPESGSLGIEVPLSSEAPVIDPAVAGRFELARSRLPLAFPGSAHDQTDENGTLHLRRRSAGWPAERIDDLWFASADWGPVAASGTQSWVTDGDELVLNLPPGEAPLAAGEALRGLLVMTEQTGDGGLTRGSRSSHPHPASRATSAGRRPIGSRLHAMRHRARCCWTRLVRSVAGTAPKPRHICTSSIPRGN